MFLETLFFRAAGVSYSNDDGTSRQRNISKLRDGERLFLAPYEYEGEPAFHIVDCDDRCIGNVPKIYIPDILNHKEAGHSMTLSVSDILGKDENGHRISGYNLGVEVAIDFFDDQPEPVEENPKPEQPTAELAPAPAHKSKQKTGRVMIGFGVFFALGFFVAFNPVVLVIAAVLLFFGIRRYKAFKALQKENGEPE